MLVVFSGGSGVGKNTVINHLLKNEKYELLPTYTTREKRKDESEGKPYYFVSEEAFLKKSEEGDFFEQNIVHGNYYGTSKKLFEEKACLDKILLKDIDVMGTQNLVNSIGDYTEILTFFLRVDSKEILVQRLKERGETEIEKRLARYEMEQTYQKKYDYIITNVELEKTLGIVDSIITFIKENRIIKSTQSVRCMNEEKIRKMAEVMSQNPDYFEPIDIAINNRELYIIDGHHRYLASLLSGCKIACRVVEIKYIDEYEQYSWMDSIEYFTKEKNNAKRIEENDK